MSNEEMAFHRAFLQPSASLQPSARLDRAAALQRSALPQSTSEWLEADGLGGFASGTVGGARSRRYHALLLVATTPPTGRLVLVNGFDAWVETPQGRFAISTQRYTPDVTHPDGAQRLESFELEPWPHWTFRLEDGTRIEQHVCARHGEPLVALSWRLVEPRPGIRLHLRPFLSGRDYHALHHENGAFRFEPVVEGPRLRWHPYEGVPEIVVLANATYEHSPEWFRSFLYDEERNRGLDSVEDLASPGVLHWDLSAGAAAMLVGTAGSSVGRHNDARELWESLSTAEAERRGQFASPQHRAADAYLVQRGTGRSVVAGYPWFTDWGRDTFIALRGLCLATGRLQEATDIVLEWAGAVSRGMLPNLFPDGKAEPEFNSVDASLWYVVAVHDLLSELERAGRPLAASAEKRLQEAVQAILTGFAAGTRFGIGADRDGLLFAGEPGWQLTWMDAKVGDFVVTPRIGKPVEIQALWLNALWIATATRLAISDSTAWKQLHDRALAAFRRRFWNTERGCLFDVIDVDHVAGRTDASFRPNQVFAIGGLPRMLLDIEQARTVVDAVQAQLWTPLGLRSLAPGEPGYRPHYTGGVWDRDTAYHQGTVWPWLAGPFVDAWVRVRGDTAAAKSQAQALFLAPLLAHLHDAGLGHISEIADADPPHTPRGCPFQAWSLGELLWLEHRLQSAPALEPTPGR